MENLLHQLKLRSTEVFNKFGSELESYSLFILNDDLLQPNKAKEITNISFEEFKIELKQVRNSNEFVGFAFGKYLDKLFQDSKFTSNLIGIYEQMGQIALSLNYPTETIHFSKIIINYNDHKSTSYSIALENIAKAYRNLGNYSKAVEFYLKAKESYNYQNDKIRETWVLFHLGKMYLNYLNQPSRAGIYILQAKEAFENIEGNNIYKQRGISSCLDELGDLYRQSTENIDQAIIQYKQALKINEKYGYRKGIARNYAHLGLSYEMQNNIEDAIKYLEDSINILRTQNRQEKGLGIRLIQLGHLYSKIEFYKKANQLINEGMEICRSHRIFQYLSKGLIFKAIILKRIGKISTAIELLNEALTLATNKGLDNILTFAYEELGEVYTTIGDFSSAKDMLINSNHYNIESWRTVYKSSPALEEIEFNSKEVALMYKSLFDKLFKDYTKTNQKTTETISNFFELLISQEKDKVQNLGNLFKFGALMSGVRHEVSNLLNNINSELNKLIRINKNLSLESTDTINYIKEKCLSGIDLLHNQSVIPVQRITDFNPDKIISTKYVLPVKVKQIIDNFSHFDINFIIEHDFGDYQMNCDLVSLQMILHSIILNSCESFNKHRNESKTIKISGKYLNEKYQILIEDNGKGIEKEVLPKIFEIGFTTKSNSTGLGLASVKFLLDSINGNIEVFSEIDKGTKVYLIFKTIKDEKNIIN
jgi:signal transduction histidine kinase